MPGLKCFRTQVCMIAPHEHTRMSFWWKNTDHHRTERDVSLRDGRTCMVARGAVRAATAANRRAPILEKEASEAILPPRKLTSDGLSSHA